MRADEIRHARKEHGDNAVEALRGQQAITAEDIALFPSIVNNYDAVLLAHDNSLHFIKNVGGKITAVTLYARKSKSVSLKTMYKGVNSGDAFQAANTPEGQGHNVQNDLGATVSTHINISDSAEESKKKNKNLSDASRDPFAADSEAAPAADSDLRPVEMPELIKMVEDLIGKRPAVMRRERIKGGA